MKIILIGPQGSGKGTYAELITKEYKIPTITMGRLLRQLAKTEKYKYLQEDYMSKGILVPDKLTIEILKERIKKEDCQKGFILDGFPRTKNQAEQLDKITDIDLAIYIDISDETAIKRLSSRRQCEKCGKIYNIITNPPPKENQCECGGKLYIREDDKPEAIKQRLNIFHNQTKEVIDFYREKQVLQKVNGEPDIQAVFKEIDNIINIKNK